MKVTQTLCSILAVALPTLFLGSCVQCYNERFGQDMIGASEAEVVAMMGAPTSSSTVAGITTLTWAIDESYTSTYTRDGYMEEWRDRDGVKHTVFRPAETVPVYNSRKANLSFMCQNGRVINYQTSGDYQMCNSLVPNSVIQNYKAADEAAKRAQSGR